MTEPRTTTPARNLRMSDDLWGRLGEVAQIQGTTRTALITELTRWYLDEYGRPAMPHLPIPPRPEDRDR